MIAVAGVLISISLIIAWLEINRLQAKIANLNGRLTSLELRP